METPVAGKADVEAIAHFASQALIEGGVPSARDVLDMTRVAVPATAPREMYMPPRERSVGRREMRGRGLLRRVGGERGRAADDVVDRNLGRNFDRGFGANDLVGGDAAADPIKFSRADGGASSAARDTAAVDPTRAIASFVNFGHVVTLLSVCGLICCVGYLLWREAREREERSMRQDDAMRLKRRELELAAELREAEKEEEERQRRQSQRGARNDGAQRMRRMMDGRRAEVEDAGDASVDEVTKVRVAQGRDDINSYSGVSGML